LIIPASSPPARIGASDLARPPVEVGAVDLSDAKPPSRKGKRKGRRMTENEVSRTVVDGLPGDQS
jgi:hypothetical protein